MALQKFESESKPTQPLNGDRLANAARIISIKFGVDPTLAITIALLAGIAAEAHR